MEFIDIISIGRGKYIERWYKCFSGKREVVEISCSYLKYQKYKTEK